MSGLRQKLAEAFPAVEVTEYDADQRGRPSGSFDWSLYDLVVIHHDLGPIGSACDWIREQAADPGSPPCMLLLAEPDLGLAAQAGRAGARSVLCEQELSAARLRRVIDGLLGSDCRPGGSAESPDEATVRDLHAFRRHFKTTAGTNPARGYRFHRLIGQGALSRVYLGECMEDGRTVVLKLLDANLARDPSVVRRFVKEAGIIAQLDSPHVVKIYEQGFTNRYGFLAMEFFSRGDLKQRVERGLSVDDTLIYMINIARGLAAIHGAGIIHRDLKPANVMFRADESMALADFGVSKNIDETTELTIKGEVVGTPHYMSPEQARSGSVDARSDLYSAGVMFFEMLTGRRPYIGDTVGAILYQHMYAKIPDLPRELQAFQPIIDRLLHKAPEKRYQSARELLAAVLSARSTAQRRPTTCG